MPMPGYLPVHSCRISLVSYVLLTLRSTKIDSLDLLTGDLGQHVGQVVGVFFLHL